MSGGHTRRQDLAKKSKEEAEDGGGGKSGEHARQTMGGQHETRDEWIVRILCTTLQGSFASAHGRT